LASSRHFTRRLVKETQKPRGKKGGNGWFPILGTKAKQTNKQTKNTNERQLKDLF
jgi:hypothetical protein